MYTSGVEPSLNYHIEGKADGPAPCLLKKQAPFPMVSVQQVFSSAAVSMGGGTSCLRRTIGASVETEMTSNPPVPL